jgi:lysophospholipase L1-like esterase
LNAGVSGQTVAQITARKSYLVSNVDCDIVVIDAGTNDMSSLAKEDIQTAREALADYYLSNGKIVILFPILSRDIVSWAAGTAERKKAAWINAKTRSFVNERQNCYLFDWNETWIDLNSTYGVPKTGYCAGDGIHFAPLGGYAVGKAFATFLDNIMPPAQRRVWSPDDIYDATYNPYGNGLSNPFQLGTGGAIGTGVTGSVATGMRIERSSGTSTAVASKEVRSDGRGEYQVITITPSGSGNDLFYYRTYAADTSHTLAAGTWVQASVEVNCAAWDGWRGISLYLKDQGAGGLIAYGMEPFDDGAGNTQWPTEAWSGTLITPPIQIVSGSTLLRWRVEINSSGTGTGAGVVKFGEPEMRPVDDPRLLVNMR